MVAYVLLVDRIASDMDGAGTDLANNDTVDLNGFKLTLDLARAVGAPYLNIPITDGSVAQTGTIDITQNLIMYNCSFDWTVMLTADLATNYLFSYNHNTVLGSCYCFGTGTMVVGLTQWNYANEWRHDGTVIGAGNANRRKVVSVYKTTIGLNLNFTAGLETIGEGQMDWCGHKAALSFEFDDTQAVQYTDLRPVFLKNGVRATVNIVSSLVGGGANYLTWAKSSSYTMRGLKSATIPRTIQTWIFWRWLNRRLNFRTASMT